MHWTTKTEYVDVNTGEELTKRHIDKEIYVITSKEIKNEIQNNYFGIRKILYKCEVNRQTKLEL